MADLFDDDGGFSRLSREDLDRIAVERCGVLETSGSQYAIRRTSSTTRFGWATTHIASRGTGNGGDLVLVARDPRTYELAREGWRRRFMALGLSAVEADAMVTATRRRHGREPEVVAAALALLRELPRQAFPLMVGTSHHEVRREILRWTAVQPEAFEGLSWPRKASAMEVANAAASIYGGW